MEIVTTHKSALESAIGANITDVEPFFVSTTPTTSPVARTAEQSSDTWRWAAIGVGVAVVVIIVIIAIAF